MKFITATILATLVAMSAASPAADAGRGRFGGMSQPQRRNAAPLAEPIITMNQHKRFAEADAWAEAEAEAEADAWAEAEAEAEADAWAEAEAEAMHGTGGGMGHGFHMHGPPPSGGDS